MLVEPVIRQARSRRVLARRGGQLEWLEPRRLLTGDGLVAQYFDRADFTSPAVVTRIDPLINFDWGNGSPAPEIAPDTFAVRWTGQIEPQFSETYTFSTIADDGVRLWIDNQLVIDDWIVHAPTMSLGAITLEAGRRYDIQLEYFENYWGATVALQWESPSTEQEIIPTQRLYSNPAGVITGFTLFDADIDAPIAALDPNAVIDLSQLPTKNLSFRADYLGGNVESVRFNLNQEPGRVENTLPFMLNGNNEANVYPWAAKEGTYTLTATPYELDNALGARGMTYSLNFNVIDPETPPPAPSKLAVRSTSDRDVTLSWKDNSGNACDFAIERSEDGIAWVLVGTTGYELYTDSSLTSKTRYQYRVKAFNPAGESGYTSRVRVRTDEWVPEIPGFPNAHTTGPTNRAILVPISGFTVTQDNAVIENVYITGQLNISAHNVTIRNFVIEAGSNVGIKVNSPYTGTVIEDGEITGPNSTNGVSGSNYTARRLHIHHMGSDAFRVYRNVIIEGCYVHDLGIGPESHGDGVQMYPTDGGNIVIHNNHFDARGANAALFQVNGGWQVGGNYLNGGNFTIQAGGEVGNKFVNNTFGRAAKYGIIRIGSGDAALLFWSGNVWADTGMDIPL